jgi:hypothetical protein
MKLKDLFEDRAVGFEMTELPDFSDSSLSKKVGTFDGYEIWGSRFYGSAFDTYGILDDGKAIAIIVISTKEQLIAGIKFQEIQKIWVAEQHRGRALSACLIGFIVKKLHTSLSSGNNLTDAGEKLLKKMIDQKSFKFSILDKADNQIKSMEQISKDALFKLPNDLELIIVEAWGRFNGSLSEHPKLSELRKFRGDPHNIWD